MYKRQHCEAVWWVVKDEGWKLLRRVKVPLISTDGQKKQVERARGLINKLKSAPQGRIIFFSDEKNFVDPVYNAQNDRWICFQDEPSAAAAGDNGTGRPSGKYLARSKHPASAMFLGAVASTGEALPPIWFPTGFRLDSESYVQSLKKP